MTGLRQGAAGAAAAIWTLTVVMLVVTTGNGEQALGLWPMAVVMVALGALNVELARRSPQPSSGLLAVLLSVAGSCLLVATYTGLSVVVDRPLAAALAVVLALISPAVEGLRLLRSWEAQLGGMVRMLRTVSDSLAMETDADRAARRATLKAPVHLTDLVATTWGVARLTRWVLSLDGGADIMASVARGDASDTVVFSIVDVLRQHARLQQLIDALQQDPDAQAVIAATGSTWPSAEA